ncbi:hypothetical protein GOV04_04660 [Candidatus Woesearchaeota archaeon]|nr:hypothetical protein [Candidatus Woesearchaeota archaeon]
MNKRYDYLTGDQQFLWSRIEFYRLRVEERELNEKAKEQAEQNLVSLLEQAVACKLDQSRKDIDYLVRTYIKKPNGNSWNID